MDHTDDTRSPECTRGVRLLTNQRGLSGGKVGQDLTLTHQKKVMGLVTDTEFLVAYSGGRVHLELKKEAGDERLGALSPWVRQEVLASVGSLRERVERGGEGA